MKTVLSTGTFPVELLLGHTQAVVSCFLQDIQYVCRSHIIRSYCIINVLVHKIVKLCKPVKYLKWRGFVLSHSLMKCRFTGPSSSPWPFTLLFSAVNVVRLEPGLSSWLAGRRENDDEGELMPRSLTPAGTDPQRTAWQPRSNPTWSQSPFKSKHTHLYCWIE